MNNADKHGLPTFEQILTRAKASSEALNVFLQQTKQHQPATHLDVVGFSFLLKEAIRFNDILLLAEQGRFFGARSLLRGLWESRITLLYLINCSNNPEQAATAYCAFTDWEWAEQMRKSSTVSITQTAQTSVEMASYRQAFESLSTDVKKFCKADTNQMCIKLDQRLNPTDKYGYEYDVIFRQYSNYAHGKIRDAQKYYDILERTTLDAISYNDDQTRGILGQAIVFLSQMAQAWFAKMGQSPYKDALQDLLMAGVLVVQ